MLGIGDRAPDFEGRDQSGAQLRLCDLLREGPLVLYFYPADFTPICTAEACAFRDRSTALADASIRILGISPQSATSHQRFAETYGLTFPLLADGKKRIIRAYGVDGPLGFGVRRATFLIEPGGTIGARVVSDLFVGSHTEFINQILTNRGAGP